MKRFAVVVAILLLPAGLAAADKAAPGPAKLPPTANRAVDFQRDVQPIFAKSCVSCHGPIKQRGGLRLDDGTEALKGSNSGAVIKPGDAAHSRLLHLVAGLDPDTRMPPE